MKRSGPITFAVLAMLAGLSIGFSTRSRVPIVHAQTPANACVAGQFINSQLANTGQSCGAPSNYLSGTTGTITGTLLAVGNSDSGTATVTGATAGVPCDASATDGSLPTSGTFINCTVTSANTVTVQITAYVIGTPGNKAYAVRVLN